jgi:hypothetical protein
MRCLHPDQRPDYQRPADGARFDEREVELPPEDAAALADAARKARGLVARLRAAWRGE